jgi:hypothetical protein
MRILLNTRSGVTAGALALVVLIFGTPVSASSWNGIEPFKSRRADVIKILGEPLGESPDGVMRFAVMGGSVQVSFVSERFVAAKKLRTDLAGTVLEIVLQHEHSSDTPESLKLVQNRSFTRDETQTSIVFRNLKEGILYTFMQGNLRTTRYTFGDEQLGRARRY